MLWPWLIIIFADDDDEHSYHFRGKPELLAGISEENLLEQLEIEYLGDITSCNKVKQQLSQQVQNSFEFYVIRTVLADIPPKVW